jgi:hypothetical protein
MARMTPAALFAAIYSEKSCWKDVSLSLRHLLLYLHPPTTPLSSQNSHYYLAYSAKSHRGAAFVLPAAA